MSISVAAVVVVETFKANAIETRGSKSKTIILCIVFVVKAYVVSLRLSVILSEDVIVV